MTSPAVPTSTGNPLIDDMGSSSYNDIISQYLTQWGLSDLTNVVQQLGATGAGSDQINLTLQATPEWQARFAGNAGRVAKGLAPLDPASYIALEDQYAQATNNLPAGFYDNKQATDSWIAGDVSASEVADRVQMANQAYVNAPASAQQAWDQFYGNTAGQAGAIASILDPTTAESVIQQQVNTAAIGGAAIQQGLYANQSIAGQAAKQGVSLASAQKAYSDIATRLATDTSLSGRFAGSTGSTGTAPSFGQTQEEQATLLGQAPQLRQQNTLYAEESSQFSGHGAASDASGNPGSNY